MAAPMNLAIQVKRALMSIASAFNNAYCTLVNGAPPQAFMPE